ncbi:MAG TPA: biotin--[acetyl-CoA-carboxylase] ligase [Bacteroidales bacterium]|jgi:BirA family transcriptional regulator, biotin operon repressor / biotin---[acetyl-CoA-carboxylase] ligase|nr:biotin--[acetyl-CoA-carboxylase] ligase [Bacteroidales bacterium]HBZ20171.1 biotin--[acetyl-CoA-carboxylase] ligase [Bacteroidales bacterium]
MIIGSGFIHCKEVVSTNTHASVMIQSDSVTEGTIFYADYQSGGRGQKGNRWVSEVGKNLLFSIVLYPVEVHPADQFIMSIFVSLGICDFLKNHIPDSKIKWPNDIYAGDDKIAGILIENSIISDTIANSIIGIGMNINQEVFPEELPNPVSLKLITGKDYDLNLCLIQLARFLDIRYKQVIAGDREIQKKEYIASLYKLNSWCRFNSSAGFFDGRIVSVADSGCLKIEDRKGQIREFAFKEIEFCQ